MSYFQQYSYGHSTTDPYENEGSNFARNNVYDIKELLKSEILKDQSDEIRYNLFESGTAARADYMRAPVQMQEEMKPQKDRKQSSGDIGLYDIDIYLDSANKEQQSQPQNGFFSYSIRGVNDESVTEVIAISVFEFEIPIVNTNPIYQPDYFFTRTLFLDIPTLSRAQGVLANGPAETSLQKFLFEFRLTLATDRPYWIATPKWRTFRFREPVQDLNQLNLQFKVPWHNAAFPNDCFTITAIASAGPPPLNRRVTTTQPHGLTIGAQYSAIVSTYNSANSSLNNALTNPIGNLVDIIDATTIQFTTTPGADLIGTTLTTDGGLPTGRLCVLENRIALRLQVTTLRPYITNYIVPSATFV